MNQNINLKFQTSTAGVSSSISKLSGAMGNLTNQTGRLKTSTANATKNMNAMRGSLRNLNVDGNRANKTFGSLTGTITKMNFAFNSFLVMKTGQAFANTIIGAMDAIEVLNMFEVSMGNTAEATDVLLQKISNVAGIDLTNLRQATGTFNILARSMGLASDTSKKLGLNATQMALDMSSLFNVKVSQAMADLKSGLVGQTETMYKYGVDITEASLKTEALRLGIEKSVRTMTQGEKMYLRMSLMMRQLTPTVGDMAKTIEQPANQLRILGERLTALGRNIGTLFLNTFGRILPYLNAVVKVLDTLIQMLMRLFGVESQTATSGADPYAGIGSSAEEAGESVDALKKSMDNVTAGIDELNVISMPTAGAGAGAGGAGAIGGALDLPALDEYDLKLSKIKQKADDIAEAILDWLGYTVDVDEETGKWNISLKDGYTNIEKIRDLIIVCGTLLAGWKLYSLFASALPVLARLISDFKGFLLLWKEFGLATTLKGLFPVLEKINFAYLGWAGLIAFVIARFYELWQKSDTFRKGLERIGEVFDAVFGVVVDKFLIPIWDWLKLVGESIAQLLPPEIRELVRKFFDMFIGFVETLDLDFADLLITLGGIALLFGGATTPFGLALLAFELITIAIRELGAISDETWELIKTTVTEKVNAIIEFAKIWFSRETWDEIFNNLNLALDAKWDEAMEWLSNTALVRFFDEIILPAFSFENMSKAFKGIKDGLIETIKNGINVAIGLMNKFIGWLNEKMKFKWDDFEVGGKKLVRAGSVQLFTIQEIPFLARGGILDGGTPFVAGEGGMSEAIGSYNGKTTVMPLENTDFVDAIYNAVYSAISEAQSGGGQIVENILMLDNEVIYRGQQKVSRQKGINFGLGEFTR